MERREKKTITYRTGAIAFNMIVALFFGIPLGLATIFGVGIAVILTGWYYMHEMLWEKREKESERDE